MSTGIIIMLQFISSTNTMRWCQRFSNEMCLFRFRIEVTRWNVVGEDDCLENTNRDDMKLLQPQRLSCVDKTVVA